MTKVLRVYVDTSVIGGCEDEEFAEYSLRLLQRAKNGSLVLLISDLVVAEIDPAPEKVKEILASVPKAQTEAVKITETVIRLREAYISAGVIGSRWVDDATHVAAATVAGADAIVSWNFKHIVRLDRIMAYNEVNVANGYRPLTIVSPREVSYED